MPLFIEKALTKPAGFKLHGTAHGRRTGKWILRKAFEDLLPSDINRRDEEQFDEGSGTVNLLPAVLENSATLFDGMDYRTRPAIIRPLCCEAYVYHGLSMERFERPRSMVVNDGR